MFGTSFLLLALAFLFYIQFFKILLFFCFFLTFKIFLKVQVDFSTLLAKSFQQLSLTSRHYILAHSLLIPFLPSKFYKFESLWEIVGNVLNSTS